MIIVDNTVSSPKWVAPPPKPTFRTTLEKQKYWATEKERWREGYGEGHAHLSGMHYFYLTQGWIKDGSDGTIIRPRYRDSDEYIISPLHDAFWNLKNHIGLVKRREIGSTSIGAGMLPAYTMRMFPSSTFGLTSCDNDRIAKAYYDKTMVYLDEMDIDIKPKKEKSNETKQNIYLRLQWMANENDESVLRYSDLFAKETTANEGAAKGFSGTRMRAAYYDEFPLHRRKKQLLNSSTSCFMRGAEQSGMLFWGGTVEEGITAEQIQELQQLVQDSELLNFNVIFAPAWWGLFLDKNGVSDEKKGVEWVMRERERLDKLEDKSFLKAFIKNYPLSLDEIFELGKGSRWDDYAVEKINLQVKELSRNKPPISGYEIVEKVDGSLDAIPKKESTLKILEHPKEGVKYVLAVDATQSTDNTSGVGGNSKFAICVFKGVEPQAELQFAPVATLIERPKNFDEMFEKGIRLLKYYNQYDLAKICGELNATGGVFAEKITKAGLHRCHITRKDLNKKGFVNMNKLWYYRVDSTIDWQNLHANTYFKKYSEYIKFIEILHDAQKPSDANTDILDAFLGCLWGFGSGSFLDDKQAVKAKRKVSLIVGWKEGKPIWEDKEF